MSCEHCQDKVACCTLWRYPLFDTVEEVDIQEGVAEARVCVSCANRSLKRGECDGYTRE